MEAYLKFNSPDVLLLSETKRRADGYHERIEFEGYSVYPLERSGEDKAGGGDLWEL